MRAAIRNALDFPAASAGATLTDSIVTTSGRDSANAAPLDAATSDFHRL
jgi:hypothetical protein